MAGLARGKKIVFIVVGILLVLAAVQYINWFVYPFSSANPNFADVEAVYNKMQIPSTWTKTGEGANKGIAGRQCGIESNGCFSKSATFNVPQSVTVDEIKNVYIGMGCISVVSDKTEQSGGPSYTVFRCSSGGIILAGTLKELTDGWQQSVIVSSK